MHWSKPGLRHSLAFLFFFSLVLEPQSREIYASWKPGMCGDCTSAESQQCDLLSQSVRIHKNVIANQTSAMALKLSASAFLQAKGPLLWVGIQPGQSTHKDSGTYCLSWELENSGQVGDREQTIRRNFTRVFSVFAKCLCKKVEILHSFHTVSRPHKNTKHFYLENYSLSLQITEACKAEMKLGKEWKRRCS